jgi:hypothetical protein
VDGSFITHPGDYTITRIYETLLILIQGMM